MSEDTAKTFAEAGIINPNDFSRMHNGNVDWKRCAAKNDEGKYYLK